MADKTNIEWTEATWNPITGCSRVSEGCVNCYAERLAAGRLQHHPSRQGLTENGRWNGLVNFNDQWLGQPLRWRTPRRIFVCAHSDLFHPNIPSSWINAVFAVMLFSPQHTFQVLTKRPERMRLYLDGLAENWFDRLYPSTRIKLARCGIGEEAWEHARGNLYLPLPNVWFGTSVENQPTANQRLPELIQCSTNAEVLWVSIEPLLGPVDMLTATGSILRQVDWVVVGGESGPGYRPMDLEWARDLRDECAYLDIPFFMKQTAGKKPIPADLLVREYPSA